MLFRSAAVNAEADCSRAYAAMPRLAALISPSSGQAWWVVAEPRLPLLQAPRRGARLPTLPLTLRRIGISNAVLLKSMRRPANNERNFEGLAAWRPHCPQIVVCSTFIAEFAGVARRTRDRSRCAWS